MAVHRRWRQLSGQIQPDAAGDRHAESGVAGAVFATPLALAAAMYTAWFMSPGLRRWVKPGIEMMGALPSVVIGLIAGGGWRRTSVARCPA